MTQLDGEGLDMRPMICKSVMLLLVIGLVAAGTRSGADEGETAARAILDKGIHAVGGAAPLSKVVGLTASVKGIIHFPGDRTLPLAVNASVQSFDRFRLEAETIRDRPIEARFIVNGSKRWFVSKRLEVTKEYLLDAGLAQDMYAMQLVQLLAPLKDKDFTLSVFGEIKVGDRPALGIRASHADRPDVNIFFDKETSLPVKCELRVRAETTSAESTHSILFSDYREVEGIKLFTKLLIQREDTTVFTAELADLKLHERFDAKTFSEP